MVKKAKARKADVVVFPERAISGSSALEDIQVLAREYAITVVIGMEHQLADGLRNSAFVIGSDGSILTRYDQLSAEGKYKPGVSPSSMWFRIKGAPAVVTIGRDALWSELAELAAVAGAQIHIHLQNDPVNTPEANLKRLQIWANMASFRTFTAVANVRGSTLWEDLYTSKEIHSVMDRTPRPATGTLEIFSPWSANLIRQAKADSLIIASTSLPGFNNYHPRWTSNFNPQMEIWYRTGAKVIQSDAGKGMKNY